MDFVTQNKKEITDFLKSWRDAIKEEIYMLPRGEERDAKIDFCHLIDGKIKEINLEPKEREPESMI
ncbi:hypothetical protein DRH27_04265 [Candidatus Falkowbacteria bacterium]|nr:MAG: hypothetical protein DRH27_04265 [Candidatus Falkowbacteria bacterium]